MTIMTSGETMRSSIRVTAALVIGVAIATLVPFFRPWIPLWIWRAAIFSAATWWLLPRIMPGSRQASGINERQPIDISAGEIVGGQEWFVVRTQPAPLPKRLVVFGLFFGALFAFFGVLLIPPHSAFMGDGASHLAAFLIVGLPAGVWALRYLGNQTRKLVRSPFSISADVVRLPSPL